MHVDFALASNVHQGVSTILKSFWGKLIGLFSDQNAKKND
jgi:hypothetical protein